jgi:hypothetical protein
VLSVPPQTHYTSSRIRVTGALARQEVRLRPER